jgi:hypothetical protein
MAIFLPWRPNGVIGLWIRRETGRRIDIAWHAGEKYEMIVHSLKPDELLTRCLRRRKASTSPNQRQTVLWLSDFGVGSVWLEERPEAST